MGGSVSFAGPGRALFVHRGEVRFDAGGRRPRRGGGARGAAARSGAPRHARARRPASYRLSRRPPHACRSNAALEARHPALRQAAIHFCPPSAERLRVGEAGGGARRREPGLGLAAPALPLTPAVERLNPRPVNRPQRFVGEPLDNPEPLALHRRAPELDGYVVDRRRRRRQDRLAGRPGHLQKRVDRAVERQRGRGQERVFPRPPFGDQEFEEPREQPRVQSGVVFEDEGEVEAVVDDPSPGGPMAQERANLRKPERERIAWGEAGAPVDRLNLRGRQLGAVDRRHHFARDRQRLPQILDRRFSVRRALEMQDESLGQDWPPPKRPVNAPANRAARLLAQRPLASHPKPKFSRRSKDQPMPDRAEPTKPAIPARVLPISATVICKNEAACIGKCLESLAGVAEIIVVDSGSTDDTLAIVEAHAERGLPIKLIHQAWLGYANQKQFALDQAREPWALSIDADEWLDDDLRKALPSLVATDASIVGWRLRRTLTLYGRSDPVTLWTRPEHILRLVRRGHARFDSALIVHEGLIADGPTKIARKGLLRHERALPLDEQMRKEIVYAKLKAEQRLGRGRKPSALKLLFNPPIYFLRIFFWNRFFLCGSAGFIHAMTGAIYSFMTETMHRQFYYARK